MSGELARHRPRRLLVIGGGRGGGSRLSARAEAARRIAVAVNRASPTASRRHRCAFRNHPYAFRDSTNRVPAGLCSIALTWGLGISCRPRRPSDGLTDGPANTIDVVNGQSGGGGSKITAAISSAISSIARSEVRSATLSARDGLWATTSSLEISCQMGSRICLALLAIVTSPSSSYCGQPLAKNGLERTTSPNLLRAMPRSILLRRLSPIRSRTRQTRHRHPGSPRHGQEASQPRPCPRRHAR